MKDFWWNDLLDHNSRWQGLDLTVCKSYQQTAGLEIQSGHNGRIVLQVNGETLLWASMQKNQGGIWLVFNADNSAQRRLLPTLTSADIESAKHVSEENLASHWCRYFTRQLIGIPVPLLSPGRWLLRPMEQVKPVAPYVLNKNLPFKQWIFKTPASSPDMDIHWSLYSEDFPDLQTPEKVLFVDNWSGGYRLLARYPVDPTSGRVKWWRKKCRENALPPILLWFIAGLASFVIIDGHDRLQASLAEGVQPQFLVLSQLSELVLKPDEDMQARILHSLTVNQGECDKIDVMNQALINLYTTRHIYASTYSRAVLGDGKDWEREVKTYLLRHHLESYLAEILPDEK